MNPDLAAREYRPELASRRGEWIAWGCALLCGAAWLILLWSSQPISLILPILTGFLLLVALSISLGNWVDRHTVLRLDSEGVAFENGLRRVSLKWDEIQQVRVVPAQWSEKVQVFGPRSYFAFHTLGQVKFQGETRGQVGFKAGKHILETIIACSHLSSRPLESAKGPVGSYYGRE
jgi:hypothetical protein